MGQSKAGVEKTDVFTEEQTENLKKLNEQTGGMMDEMMKKLGYDIEGNSLYQGAGEAVQQQMAEFDPAKVASNFEQYIGDPTRTSFQEETIPGIAERYAGVGGSRSSASQLAMGGAATNMEKGLAAQKSNTMLSAEQQKEQIRNQAIQQALQLSKAPGEQNMSALDRYTALINQGFQKQFDIGVNQGSSGMWPAAIGAAGAVIGSAVGPGGAMAGGAAGKKIGYEVGKRV